MTLRKAVLLAVLFLSATASSFGQEEFPRVETFLGYSYVNFDTEGWTQRLNTYGWESSTSINMSHWLSAVADVSGHYNGRAVWDFPSAVSLHTFLFGPQVTYRSSRANLFAHGLFGVAHGAAGVLPGIPTSETSPAIAVGGGLDYAATQTIAVRLVQADYLITKLAHGIGGTTQYSFRLSTGIVLQMGSWGERRAARPRSSGPTMRTDVALSYLGATAQNTDKGVVLMNVSPSGAAAVAGLSSGDLITAVDGKPVGNTLELAAELANRASGSRVKLTLLHAGAWVTEATLVMP